MGRYAVVDNEGNILNVAEWDGETSWAPVEGDAVELNEAEIGGTYIDNVYTPPTPPADTQVED